MKLRWTLCLLISLMAHISLLKSDRLGGKLKIQTTSPSVVVARAEPELSKPARPMPQKPPTQEKEPDIAKTVEPYRFRPNVEEAKSEKGEVGESAEEKPEQKEEESNDIELQKRELNGSVPTERPNFKKEIAEYRKQLLADFKDEWKEVPELNTLITDLDALPEIDDHFNIAILGYSFVDQKPGPPFIVFDTRNNTCRQVESFDFSSYSNRIKDRMLHARYRSQLEKARKENRINSLMKVIGLVPIETDHYFSAKQLRAVQLAGLRIDDVKATQAHYEPDGADGFNLIIDTVVTKDNRKIAVHDEELKYSVVAGK